VAWATAMRVPTSCKIELATGLLYVNFYNCQKTGGT
jgi:hypothetical protein